MTTFRKILLPTDFSEYSNRAFDHAVAWAEEFGSDVHLLHVLTVHNFDPFNPGLGFPEIEIDESLHEFTDKQMQEVADSAADREPGITMETRTGFSPWSEIVDTARENDFDLIVMATHGRRGFSKLILGSTTEKVLEHAPCPVLLLRPVENGEITEPGEVESILLPTDFSEAAAEAVPMALDLAQHFGAKLTLFHCVEQEVPPPYYAAGITSIFELNDTILSFSRQQMAKLIPDQLAEEIDHDFVVTEGRSAHELVTCAKETAADLIVMATHGYSGLEQAVIGSTTDRVVRHTPCPVLVIRCQS